MPRGLKFFLSSLLLGAMSIGAAWAGAVLSPPPIGGTGSAKDAAPMRASAVNQSSNQDRSLLAMAGGEILAGAAKVSIEPQPGPNDFWNQDPKKCETLSSAMRNPQNTDLAYAHNTRVKWLETSGCIYMGGYDLGPANAIVKSTNPYGLWARALAIRDGQGDTLVLMLVDGAYWFSDYGSLCDDCGFTDIRNRLSSELGIPAKNFMLASTHSHTSPDFVGAWGGVPEWYMEQTKNAIEDSIRQAVGMMKPAVLEAGESIVREFNGERREHYRSAEEQNLTWFRLIDASDPNRPATCYTPAPEPISTPTPENNGNGYGNKGKATPTPAPTPTPVCTEADPGTAIATVGAYAAHPTRGDKRAGEANPDFPGVFAADVEEAFGGTGLMFQTGLGNMSQSRGYIETGHGLSAAIPSIGAGRPVENADISVGMKEWSQPVTNSVLAGGGMAGIFDHPFNQLPAAVTVAKGTTSLGPDHGPHKTCTSASPISVQSFVSAAKVGSLWITGGPGELFSNLTNTIKESNPTGVTMPLALVNDGLGYIMQSFETDHLGRQGVGFVNGPFSEYEDAYSIDHCFGDMTIENTLSLLKSL